MKKNFYITTTLPYVNAAPHVGFALELIQADIIARYHSAKGERVVFNTGTDEHGLKIYRKSQEAGVSPKEYVDEWAGKFARLNGALGVHWTNFIRTTDPHHKTAAQEFWKRCDRNGFIYKDIYTVKYCVGCELEKTESELVDGKCPIHPNLEVEPIEEENYFFRFSAFQNRLLEHYKNNPMCVIPDHRLHEIISFVSAGIKDFSISRVKEKMSWGIPVPGDDTQVMYVWFDALVNYISTLGWPEDVENFINFWGTPETPNAIQIAGKDNLRQQSAMWQAMLMAAGLPPTRHILIHGFITSGGQKMSKSFGNVVDPFNIVERYGTDALRWWVGREANMYEDTDFTWEKFGGFYNAYLANGIGNLASRTMKMAIDNDVRFDGSRWSMSFTSPDEEMVEISSALEQFDIQGAATSVERLVNAANAFIDMTQPFKTIKTNRQKAVADIETVLGMLWRIGVVLEPFIPETATTIRAHLLEHTIYTTPLFPRV